MSKRLLPIWFTGICLLTFTLLSTANAAEFFTAKQPIENQYIVVLKDKALSADKTKSASNVSVSTMARRIASEHNAKVVQSYSEVLPGFVIRADKNTLVRLLDDDRIDFIEEDGIVSINATQNNATWGLDRIDQRNLPLNSRYTYNTTASNVHAYIIDTGVLGSHSEFSGRMGNGYSAINDGRGYTDCNGHGTHVAGTVAGSTYGVAKGATVHGVRVLGCDGYGSNSGIIAGMDWVAQNAQFPAVANMSLGGGASQATDNAVTRMRNAGVTVVVAAGNENQNACNVSPARSSSAITVGSTTRNDQRSSFSNWGSCVDIFAPGSDITSAWHTGNNSINTIGGTSMASPHVAGVAALYLANKPNASPAQVENAILSAATTGKISGIGAGSPNLLLYSLFDGNGDDGGDGGDGGEAVELTNGVPKTNLSGSASSEQFFKIEVPSGATNLEISMSGGTGDADLYARYNARPTTTEYECRPWRNGNNESCDAANPTPGTHYIMIRGYSSYSGVTLVASYDTGNGGGGDGTVELTNGVPQTGLSGSASSERFFRIDVPAGASDLEISMSGGTGDADMYVRIGDKPTTSTYDCRPWRNGNNESCVASSPQAGSYYIMVRGYSSYSGVSLVASFDEAGNGGNDEPCTGCSKYSGSLASGGSAIEPDGDYYYAPAGFHEGWLQGPASTDFDLDLFRWNGFDWQRVAVSQQSGSEEHISYYGSAGYYLWQVRSYYGSGSYNLWIDTP